MTLQQAIRNLRLPIPTPRLPEPRDQQSWAALKPGQLLVNLHEMVVAGNRIAPESSRWVVKRTTDQGAFLVADLGFIQVGYFLGDRDWQSSFKRTRGKS